MIYNEQFEPIESVDLAKGHIERRTHKVHVQGHPAMPEQFHFEKAKHPGFVKVVDSPAIPEEVEHDEVLEVDVYVEDSPADIMRHAREVECFPIVNRGKAWYKLLTAEQEMELDKWYQEWLDAPETLEKPQKPQWLNEKIKITEELI